MKILINALGIILILFSIILIIYQGFPYTKEEKVAQIGPIQVSAQTKEKVHFPPILIELCLVAGVVLLIAGIKTK